MFCYYEYHTEGKCKLFDHLVPPVLHYSSEIWGLNEGKDIEKIQTKFLRKILGVRQSTNLNALYSELGRVLLKISGRFICSDTG